MDAITLIREQLNEGHDILEQAVADLTPEQLHQRQPGSTVNPIAAIYAHAVLDEDVILNSWVRQQTPLYESGGWHERLRIDPGTGVQANDWAAAVRINDLPAFQEYARAVYGETDRYVASLSEGDLDPILSTPLGDRSVGNILGTILVWHAMQHGGEICALKGCMGSKGLPF